MANEHVKLKQCSLVYGCLRNCLWWHPATAHHAGRLISFSYCNLVRSNNQTTSHPSIRLYLHFILLCCPIEESNQTAALKEKDPCVQLRRKTETEQIDKKRNKRMNDNIPLRTLRTPKRVSGGHCKNVYKQKRVLSWAG